MLDILALIFLFILLTPGILFSYPKKTNKYVIAFLHASLFTLFWNYFMSTKEGLDKIKEPASKEPASKEPASKEPASKEPASKDEMKTSLKFVLTTELFGDSEVIDKIKTMEGPPTVVGANPFFGENKNKSSLLFTNQKNKTSTLDNLIKYDIIDPKLDRITKFIEFHKKYPDML